MDEGLSQKVRVCAGGWLNIATGGSFTLRTSIGYLTKSSAVKQPGGMLVCVRVCACVRACVRVCA